MKVIKFAILAGALVISAPVFAAPCGPDKANKENEKTAFWQAPPMRFGAADGNNNVATASAAAPQGSSNVTTASAAAPQGNSSVATASAAAPQGNGNVTTASAVAPQGNTGLSSEPASGCK